MPFHADRTAFHCPFHCPFAALSPFTALSLPFPCSFNALSLSFHCPFAAPSPRFRCPFTALPLSFHCTFRCPFTALSTAFRHQSCPQTGRASTPPRSPCNKHGLHSNTTALITSGCGRVDAAAAGIVPTQVGPCGKCGLSFNMLARITSDCVSFMCLIYVDCPSTCWPLSNRPTCHLFDATLSNQPICHLFDALVD